MFLFISRAISQGSQVKKKKKKKKSCSGGDAYDLDAYGDDARWLLPDSDTNTSRVETRLTAEDVKRLRDGPVGKSLRITHLLCVLMFVMGHFLLSGGLPWPLRSLAGRGEGGLQCPKGQSWERCFLRERLGIRVEKWWGVDKTRAVRVDEDNDNGNGKGKDDL